MDSYGYCYQNPVQLVDPDGKNPIIPLLLWKAAGNALEKYGSNSDVKTVGYSMNHPINAVKTGHSDLPKWGISMIVSNFEVNLRNEAQFSSGEGSQGNAYRHALWQAILSNEFGSEHARRIGNAHEDNIPNNLTQREFGKDLSKADQMADILNNIIGRRIGEKNKGSSNLVMAVAVLHEYRQNGLWRVTGNEESGYKVEKMRLSLEQYKQALKVLLTKGDDGLNK